MTTIHDPCRVAIIFASKTEWENVTELDSGKIGQPFSNGYRSLV
jgi:hypothetical protein